MEKNINGKEDKWKRSVRKRREGNRIHRSKTKAKTKVKWMAKAEKINKTENESRQGKGRII